MSLVGLHSSTRRCSEAMALEITLNVDLHTRTQVARPLMIQEGCQSSRPAVYEGLNEWW